jgi:putative ABC transport system permease protein
VVTAVATVIEGANVYIKEKIATLGSGVFTLQKASITSFGDFQKFLDAFRRNPDLTLDDLSALRESATLAEQIGAQDGGSKSVKYGNVTLDNVGVQGVTPKYAASFKRRGRTGPVHKRLRRRQPQKDVAFLGSEVAEGLFPQVDPIGKDIKIGADTYMVIGVAKKLGSVLGQSQDNFVQLPLMTFFKAFGKRSSPTFRIIIRSRSTVGPDKVQDQVRMLMRTRHKLDYNEPDDFSIATDEATEQLLGSIVNVVAAVAFPVVGISLVIGGIVINEHNARERHRAHARNWDSKIAGSDPQRHIAAVLGGVGDDVGHRRLDWFAARGNPHGDFEADRPGAGGSSSLGAGDSYLGIDARWSVFWIVSGESCRATGSNHRVTS